MESNKIIEIDSIWCKIKKFFKRFFSKRSRKVKEEIATLKINNTNFYQDISVKKELEQQNEKDKLAKKLIENDLYICCLTDEEIDDMTKWFKEDIEAKNKELDRIREHIVQMKKELEET